MATKEKNVKNDKKKLEVSKKSSTFVPGLTIYSHNCFPLVFEKSSPTPTPNLVPNEAVSIRELLIRTQRGQRLDVHTRMRTDDCPDNMYRAEYEKDPLTGEIRMKADPFEETIDHTPPSGMHDIVDVQRYSEEIAERKKALLEKRKKDVANARQSVPAGKQEVIDEGKVAVPPTKQSEGEG